ncbi:ATP-dependent Clp protease ATP-binding subunit [Natranaerofaba carboxydovora]|uniref:ATP-dependent Clp protease ATP-binding subunit n=1 Tax=Natranaerofaba carboxydovora TaxID=2742683 RepID=UPI001F12D776|nr:ATP-dependent Clp protease ATP-binding subunit [Natranaerofaba carboxydovora]UMZ74328.1 Negative regulator of genetic competence ClpC/MecB [Natranaerofaba carboxydovora]
MSKRFTKKAQRVMTLSLEEAKSLNNDYIGTEHVLLGLLRESDGVGAIALNNLGVYIENVRGEIIEDFNKIKDYDEGEKQGYFPYTTGVKTVIELALEGAKKMGHNYVGTEHLLLGLIMEGELAEKDKADEGVASEILGKMNVSLESAREEVLKILSGFDEREADEYQEKNFDIKEGKFNKFGGEKFMKQNPNSEKQSVLDSFGTDLTKLAMEDKLDPIIGREKEIERVIQVLSRRTKNNPCIVGEPGVGKTAIAEGIARKIVEGDIPQILEGKRIVSLQLASIVAGTKYRGEFEERLKGIVDEVVSNKNIILFIDELHTVIGAGGAEGAIDASNILKPALARGELQCIGATTLDEYRKNIERDSALERRFQPIKIDEPTNYETLEVLKGLRDRYEAHHEVEITDEALENAVKLSDRYITSRFLPDKAIDLIDEAAAGVKLYSFDSSNSEKELETKLDHIRDEKRVAVNHQDYEKAAELRDEEMNMIEQQQKNLDKPLQVGGEDIANVVSDWTGIPVSRLTKEESDKLLDMEVTLHKRIVGQDEAVTAVSNAIRRARAGLKSPKRPIGSFVFLGPTGVGKSELAKALAEALFADENAIIRLDMSEYMERHTTSKLVGSPPGYIGHDDGGQLTEQVRRRPYSVILFDEIEKAHPEVFNTLLQVLEDGRLTDSKGRVVDFKNTVIIMTSNVGAERINEGSSVKGLGFATEEENKQNNYQSMKNQVVEVLKNTFKPEFLNRLDEIIVFHSLEREHLKIIIDLMLQELDRRMKEFDINLMVTKEAKELLAEKGYDPAYGARPLRRVIQKYLEDTLSEKILSGEIVAGDEIIVDVDIVDLEEKESKELTFNKKEKVAK